MEKTTYHNTYIHICRCLCVCMYYKESYRSIDMCTCAYPIPSGSYIFQNWHHSTPCNGMSTAPIGHGVCRPRHLIPFLCGQGTPLGHLSRSFDPKAPRHCSSSLLSASTVGCKPFKAEAFRSAELGLAEEIKHCFHATNSAPCVYEKHAWNQMKHMKTRKHILVNGLAVFEPASYWSWRTPAVPNETRDIYSDHATICNVW